MCWLDPSQPGSLAKSAKRRLLDRLLDKLKRSEKVYGNLLSPSIFRSQFWVNVSVLASGARS